MCHGGGRVREGQSLQLLADTRLSSLGPKAHSGRRDHDFGTSVNEIVRAARVHRRVYL
jgi:hypothetical protein